MKTVSKRTKTLCIILLGVILLVAVIGVLTCSLTTWSKKESERIQQQIESTAQIQVRAEKAEYSALLTGNISEIWFSDDMTEGRVDVQAACAKYGMTDDEIAAFCAHYEDYAFVYIPLQVENMSFVTIGGLNLSFAEESESRPIWILNGEMNGFSTSVEPKTTTRCSTNALVNISECPLDEVDALIQARGLKLEYGYRPGDGQKHTETIDVSVDLTAPDSM